MLYNPINNGRGEPLLLATWTFFDNYKNNEAIDLKFITINKYLAHSVKVFSN